MPINVVAYMTTWCPDCTRARRVLERFGIAFEEIDIESVAGMEDVMRSLNGGSGKVPTLIISDARDRRVLIEPSDQELTEVLRSFLCGN